MREKLYIGADNGLSGAAAVLDASGRPRRVFGFPIIERAGAREAHIHKSINARALMVLLTEEVRVQDYETYVMVERPFAVPRKSGDGQKEVFVGMIGSMYEVYGVLSTVFLLAGAAEVTGVVPHSWKRKFDVGAKKNKSVSVARELFPEIDLQHAKDHNRAEALLIAEHCRMYHNDPRRNL